MKDIIISDLYKRIQTLCNYFTFDNNLYNTLYSVLKQGVFSNRTLNILNDVKKIKGLDNNTLNFVNQITSDIIVIGKKIEEINEAKQKLYEKLEKLKEEFKKRKLPTEELKITEKANLGSLSEMEGYLALLKEESKKLDEIKDALNKEKQAGDAFDKDLVKDTKLVDKEDLENANKVARENVKTLVNPDESTLNDILNYYNQNKIGDETFSIKFIKDKNNDVINIELTHKGTTVDESRPKFIISYTDVSLRQNDFLFSIINDYASNNTTKAEGLQNGNYINVSDSGDTLEMENFDERETTGVKQHIDRVQNENDMVYVTDEEKKELERENRHVRVREMDSNIGGKVGPGILMTIIVTIVLTVSVVIANGIFNFLKG